MWGRYIEHELNEATKGAKSDKQAMGKAQMKMRSLMSEPTPEESETPPPSGAFRDPAAKLKK